MLIAHIETTLGLSPKDCDIVQAIAAARFDTPEKCEACLETILPLDWFIYRGGNHAALHRHCSGERLIIWKPISS